MLSQHGIANEPDLLDRYHQKIIELLESTTIATPLPATSETMVTRSNIVTTAAPTASQWKPIISIVLILMSVVLLIIYLYCYNAKKTRPALHQETSPDLSTPPRYEDTIIDKRAEKTPIIEV